MPSTDRTLAAIRKFVDAIENPLTDSKIINSDPADRTPGPRLFSADDVADLLGLTIHPSMTQEVGAELFDIGQVRFHQLEQETFATFRKAISRDPEFSQLVIDQFAIDESRCSCTEDGEACVYCQINGDHELRTDNGQQFLF